MVKRITSFFCGARIDWDYYYYYILGIFIGPTLSPLLLLWYWGTPVPVVVEDLQHKITINSRDLLLRRMFWNLIGPIPKTWCYYYIVNLIFLLYTLSVSETKQKRHRILLSQPVLIDLLVVYFFPSSKLVLGIKEDQKVVLVLVLTMLEVLVLIWITHELWSRYVCL